MTIEKLVTTAPGQHHVGTFCTRTRKQFDFHRPSAPRERRCVHPAEEQIEPVSSIFRSASNHFATEVRFELRKKRAIIPFPRKVQRYRESSVPRSLRPIARQRQHHGRVETATCQNRHAATSLERTLDSRTERTEQFIRGSSLGDDRRSRLSEGVQPLRKKNTRMVDSDVFVNATTRIERRQKKHARG